MLDVKLLREDPEKVKQAIATKNANPTLVDSFIVLDKQWRELMLELDTLRAKQKKLSESREIEAAVGNKAKIKEKEAILVDIEKEREATILAIPNIPSDDTPIGKNEDENKVIRQWGTPFVFDFTPKDHLALGEKLGIIDTRRASMVAGTRFSYLKGAAAMMEFALVQYVFRMLQDEAILKTIAEKIRPGYSAKPFIPVVPPVMIRPDVFRKMARLEPEEERYYLPKDDLFLIGSAEHTLGPIHMDETLLEKDLPKRYIGFSTSFRREAGAYGKDTHGILRMHQFDKLEMESFTLPEDGIAEQDFFVAIQEYLVQSLNIPYQVVAICTGDMGAPDSRQIDIEMWMPSQNRYRETHTADYMGDYQARRLNTKVKRSNGKSEFIHMNDATAFAMSRTPIAILENYQKKDGTIAVPEVLQDYMGKKVIE